MAPAPLLSIPGCTYAAPLTMLRVALRWLRIPAPSTRWTPSDCIEACDQIFENLNKKKNVPEGLSKIELLRFRMKHNLDPEAADKAP